MRQKLIKFKSTFTLIVTISTDMIKTWYKHDSYVARFIAENGYKDTVVSHGVKIY